ncbi:MAG: OmpP1/FadL family transporter [Ectothiorhodospira sp.]
MNLGRALGALCVPGVLMTPLAAQATNAMNMDAFGAIAGGMGGASLAHETGNSAVMNNPATLGMRAPGQEVLGLGYTLLAPRVEARAPGADRADKSRGRWYHMPSLSLVRKQGGVSYGAAVMAQGGMGTDFRSDSLLFSRGQTLMGAMAPLSGQSIRSELSLGRVMFPLAFEVNDRVALAVQLDYVWAGLDLQMDLDGATFGRMAQPGGTPGLGSAQGSMVEGFNTQVENDAIQDVSYARFDFSNDDRFTGEASATGLAGKLGVLWEVTDRLAVGATYHSETQLDDLTSGDARLAFGADFGTGFQDVPVTGRIRVRDFQWPESLGLGVAYRASDRLLLAADLRHLNWSEAMEGLEMTFTADTSAANGDFAGTRLDAELEQHWKDQTVLSVGAAYRLNDRWTLRGGTNYASNPIPDGTVNPLFPAIVQHHLSGGFSYRFTPRSQLHASATYAPEVRVTQAATGVGLNHSQTVWRVNYGYRF